MSDQHNKTPQRGKREAIKPAPRTLGQRMEDVHIPDPGAGSVNIAPAPFIVTVPNGGNVTADELADCLEQSARDAGHSPHPDNIKTARNLLRQWEAAGQHPMFVLTQRGGAFGFGRLRLHVLPDWTEWRHIPEVEDWQAVALSLNIEPKGILRSPLPSLGEFVPDTFPSPTLGAEFAKRLRIVRAQVQRPGGATVKLPEFVAVAVNLGWSIPGELQALMEATIELAPAPAESEGKQPPKMATLPEGWTPEQWEQFKVHYERLRVEYAAAGGFSNWVIKNEAARRASDARGYPVSPNNFTDLEYVSACERLDAIAQEEQTGAPPELWAYWFALELAERNGWDYATQTSADGQIMRAFEVAADTLPLRQYPSCLPLKGQPLPPKWREGCFMLKAELREWAKQHAPDLLGSALLAEPAPESAPAEQAATAAAVAASPADGTVRHSTKGKRRHPLETPIEAVRAGLADPDDANAIVAALEASCPAPFLGKRGKHGGLAYTDPRTGDEAELSVKDCRDYLRTRKRGDRA